MGKGHDEKRRTFLGGGQLEIRPPWALATEDFFKKCSGCLHCLEACPEGIMIADRFGYPLVDFGLGPCTFCGACLACCPTGALVDQGGPPWRHQAAVAAGCLNGSGVLCRICGEECETRAISYPLRDQGFSRPVLDRQRCTGCGACLRLCPVAAITMIIPSGRVEE